MTLHWFIEQAWWIVKACAVLGVVGKWLLQKVKDNVEEIYKDCNTATMELFNAELRKRDATTRRHYQSIRLAHRKIFELAIATRQLAAIGLYPTVPPSQAERERVLKELEVIKNDYGDIDDDLQIT
jgi:hypothetical protein